MEVEVEPAAKTTLICVWGLMVVAFPEESMRLTPICESALAAARQMSCWRAPWGATEGEMPLKGMSPAMTRVTAACAMRAVSTSEKAKTVTLPAALTGSVVAVEAAAGTAGGGMYVQA